MVDAVHNRRIDVFTAGRGNDDLFRAALDVQAGLLFGGEETRAFEYHVDTQLTPRQLGRIALRKHLDLVAIDDQIIAFDRDGAGKLAVRRIVARQMGVGFYRAQVVDGNDLDVVFFAGFVVRAEDVTANAAVAVDGDFDRHDGVFRGSIDSKTAHFSVTDCHAGSLWVLARRIVGRPGRSTT